MILFSFAHPVETNRDFVKALLKLKETSDKLGTKPEIYFFDENMNHLNLRIFSGKFTSKYRKGLEKDKSYLEMNVLFDSDIFFENMGNKKISLIDIIEFIFNQIPEGVEYQLPVVINHSTGRYYQVSAVGFDVNFNVVFYCREIK